MNKVLYPLSGGSQPLPEYLSREELPELLEAPDDELLDALIGGLEAFCALVCVADFRSSGGHSYFLFGSSLSAAC